MNEPTEWITLSVRIDASLKAQIDAYHALLAAAAAREGLDEPPMSTALRGLLLAGLAARSAQNGR